MSSKILITGGNGYLGQLLTRKYLENTDEQLLLLVKSKDQSEFQNKIKVLNHNFNNKSERIVYKPIDLKNEYPFENLNPKTIKSIIHTGAITHFNVSKIDATQVNIDGTKKLLSFADRCSDLKQIALLSTIYSSGLKSGSIQEIPFNDNSGFANFYEWSKFEGEKYLLQRYKHLPYFIFRSATIIADCDDGKVTQYNVFHNTMRLLYQGLLTLVPGNSETPLYLVTGEFVTDAIFHILGIPRTKGEYIFHLAHSRENSISLRESIDIAFEVFSQDNQFIKRLIKKPRYINLETFNLMMQQINGFGSQSTRMAASSMEPFAQQLFISKDIENDQLVKLINNYKPDNVHDLISKTCHFLIKTNWGRVNQLAA